DKTKPDGVYVWLESYDIGTFTDSDGKFSITLPSPEASGLGSDFSGEIYLYFYFANYILDSSVVIFSNGKFSDIQRDIKQDGSLKEVKILSSLLQVNTSIIPSVVRLDENGPVKVTVKLKTFHYPLQIYYRGLLIKPPPGILKSGIVFKSIVDPENRSVLFDLPGSKKLIYNFPSFQQEEWEYNYNLNTNELLPGKYSIFPFIIINQKRPPIKLIESLGDTSMYIFQPDYIKLPMKRNDGSFEVLAAGK
ncbi:MAG: hypothetical protein ABIJ12_05120, partial [bacterium]